MKTDWNERFSRTDYLYGQEANLFIQQISPIIKPQGKFLALAEGEGRNAFFIANQALNEGRTIQIDLWDYSDVALKKVNERKGSLPIKTNEVDLTQQTWPNEVYDFAMCVYGHFPKSTQVDVFYGVRQSLTSGGYFFGEVYSESQLAYGTGGPRNLDYLYDPRLFLDLFKHDHIKHLVIGEVERHEGNLHKGRCHVIQFSIQINHNK